MMRSYRLVALAVTLGFLASSALHAAPYASGITISGTTVNYIMNQDSDVLEISINGGAFTPASDGLLKGPHSFTIPSGASFSIRADRTENGFTMPDGGTVAPTGNGLSETLPSGYGTLISSDTSNFSKYNSPRGVDVSRNPNSSNFGTAYISNSVAGATGGRTLTGDGVYAVKADQTDAYGFGDAAQGTAVLGAAATTNTPYRLTVANNGEVYVTGFGDAVSGVWRMPANLSTIDNVLAGTTGPGAPGTATCGTCLPVGQNHGSVEAVYVTGSTATSDLTVYTIDEDMTTAQLTRVNATDPKGTDTNKVWKYDVNGNTLPYSGMPTVFTSPLIPGFSINNLDLDRGADGKFYVTQLRAQPATVASLFVTDASGTVLYDSYVASQALFNLPADYNNNDAVDAADYVLWRKNGPLANEVDNPNVVDAQDYTEWRARYGNRFSDVFSNVLGMAVSPDQKWLATIHTNNTIAVTPLVSGIPDIANMLAIPTGGLIQARDIGWDAAGNIHFVSSGQGLYRVIAPGGHTIATTSWNGTSYAFNITTQGSGSGSIGGGNVPEPSTLGLLLMGVGALVYRRRR